jgi:hypothetical protein
MAEWDFAGAARQLALTKDLAAPARRVQAEAAEQGIDAAALRTAYQSADESSEYREVGAQLATFLRQVGSYASLRSDLGSADVVTRLGGAVVGSSGAVADAKAAIEDGDVPTADDALASARSRLDLASWAGLAIVLVALLLVVGAAVATWLTTRRRRPEAPVVPVISGGYVGYEGHDGYDGHDGHEGHDGHDGHTPVEATPDHESQSADPTAGAFEPSGSS